MLGSYNGTSGAVSISRGRDDKSNEVRGRQKAGMATGQV